MSRGSRRAPQPGRRVQTDLPKQSSKTQGAANFSG